jgi:hypothetical protein
MSKGTTALFATVVILLLTVGVAMVIITFGQIKYAPIKHMEMLNDSLTFKEKDVACFKIMKEHNGSEYKISCIVGYMRPYKDCACEVYQ